MTKQNNKPYSLIFVGTPEYSVPTLEALINDERFNVVAIITAPDAKIGRKQIITPPPVKITALKNNIPALQPAKLDANAYEEIKKINPDVIITIAYGQIIPEKILNLPKHGCLNLHASLLPKYRGASPIQAAIKNNEQKTGVTLMKMDKGLDTGPILAREKIIIVKNETGESLHDKLSELSAKTIIKYLPEYLLNNLKPQAQNNDLATLAPKITREDGRINWNLSAKKIEHLARAYFPWPGIWTMWNDKILKVNEVDSEILKINKYQIGEIFEYQKTIAVQCGQDSVIINKLQLQGKKTVETKEFLRGYQSLLKAKLM
ncbi:methionyl-tRNA formyltransferase [Candidatus Falkowbacteria bacterium CG10_big_fil_rev_8_21_14_0_10_37_6]|uniref:Methionyl-tRNA formyltransferase n=1 Tax=Candidatus Falkowbacteria bacterium CG10_big_fil_rev_8_21_14_0_10_37_6 TaxID=1974563 RepID=A0A2H0V6W9_9BACT|nr:MAG: methionyl-tRNA formyltransferase [Candidatus Falkowbacteria bacterium CG10_big_fil_rev_8_21_14_0_10_37_6]